MAEDLLIYLQHGWCALYNPTQFEPKKLDEFCQYQLIGASNRSQSSDAHLDMLSISAPRCSFCYIVCRCSIISQISANTNNSFSISLLHNKFPKIPHRNFVTKAEREHRNFNFIPFFNLRLHCSFGLFLFWPPIDYVGFDSIRFNGILFKCVYCAYGCYELWNRRPEIYVDVNFNSRVCAWTVGNVIRLWRSGHGNVLYLRCPWWDKRTRNAVYDYLVIYCAQLIFNNISHRMRHAFTNKTHERIYWLLEEIWVHGSE